MCKTFNRIVINSTIMVMFSDRYAPIKILSHVFSRAIPTISSAISMDRFITKVPKSSSIFDEAKTAVCVWGPYGCGKTTWVRENLKPLEIDYDDPGEFMSKVGSRWVLIDNFDSLDKAFAAWFSRPRTVYINPVPIDGLWNHEHHNKKNLRGLFGTRDIHMDPKDYLRLQMTSKLNPLDAIYKCGSEHGNGIGIVFENYPSVCSLDESLELLDSLSIASVIDKRIYSSHWDGESFKYLNHFAFAKPLSLIAGRFTGDLLPATVWSKYLNICMKRKKLKEAGLDFETVGLVREYAIKEQNPLDIQDIESLKIGDLTGRLKQKTIQKLKKCRKKSPS